MAGSASVFHCYTFFSILIISSNAAVVVDTMTANQTTGVSDNIVSAAGNFELGFFKPSKTNNWYLGIWYKKISTRTIVWVANRDNPLADSLGVLQITNPGILVIINTSSKVIWSSNSSKSIQNPVAQLLDNGNLVVRDGDRDASDPENVLWQSFDHPTNTFLPGMKFGRNLVTGLDRYLTSWTSNDDPSPGNYTYRLDPSGSPQLIVRSGTAVKFRSGPWNGVRFSGLPMMAPNPIYRFGFVSNQEELYYEYEPVNSSVFTRLVLSPTGLAQRFTWVDRTNGWVLYSSAQTDNCDNYGLCGAYGNCIINRSPQCWCLDGFVPRFPADWDGADWLGGCVRVVGLECSSDGFVKYSRLKLPDTRESWFNESMTLIECRTVCLKNCSCTGYTSSDIRDGGSGCLLWFGDLVDLREFNENGQDIYIRMAASASESVARVGSNGKRRETIIVGLALTIGMLLCLSLTLFFLKKKRGQLKRKGIMEHRYEHNDNNENQKEDLQLPLFDLATLVNATDNFSINNKLGEGGFGSVYKGILEGGQEIAVKRLSRNSRQGVDEFKNEVICIAKLQHRNLVKLLGCCIQADETMLIYEYMPNKSLNCFIFDQTRSTLLDWPKRFHIINGISQGLLYLHQDSRLRIIHRDLKASNVLLDIDMNPKISDFGMARSFGGNETEANTSKVVGTYGYMSPEYTVDGIFSIKSDVFSFGVLVLEILSGKRNRGFIHSDHRLNLVGHAWTLFKEGKSLELIDASVRDSCYLSEMLRSIHVALLCVQQYPEDRPSMSSVVLMLGSEGALPRPKQPGFFTERNPLDVKCSSSRDAPSSASANEITITLLDAR